MENKPTRSGLGRHMLLMIACCAIPLLLLAAVSTLAIDLNGIGNLLILLVCPLMMFLMMRGMGHDHSAHGQSTGQSCHGSPRAEVEKEEPKASLPTGEKLAASSGHEH